MRDTRLSSVILFFICLSFLLSSSITLAAGENGTCSSDENSFYCPNCGGMQVNDCLDCDGFLSTETSINICFNRRLFASHNTNPDEPEDYYRYLWNDLVGMFVWFVCAGIATACGVGGGGIYVPLGILLFQFAPKQASGLSQCSIFGASLGGLMLNSRNKHPNTKIRSDPGIPDDGKKDGDNNENTTASVGEPRRHLQTELSKTQEQRYLEKGGKFYTRALINYDMALFLAPMEMAGAILGVLVQRVLPNWLYLLFAACVLSFTAYKTYIKFFQARAKENKKRLEQQQQNEREYPDNNNTIKVDTYHLDKAEEPKTTETNGSSMTTSDDVEGRNSFSTDSEEDQKLRQQYLEEDSRQYPKEKVASLLVLWLILLVVVLLKGGKGVDSLIGIKCDSPWYAVLTALQFLLIFVFAAFYAWKLTVKQKARVAVRYPYLPEDPIWDRKSCVFYGVFTFIAGIVAGLIGIGGGMVLGPLMLVMGIHPSVSSATTATMIVLTSSSVAVMYVTSGLVPWTYAVFYFSVCSCGAFLGKSKIDGYVKKTGRASILIFTLATIIALATIGSLYIMLSRLAAKNWCFDGFSAFCTVVEESDDGLCVAQQITQAVSSLAPTTFQN